MRIIFSLSILLMTSCMQVPSINLKTKKFNQYPSKIIWIQLAGFDEEQIFQMHLKDGDTKKTSFDAFTCLGMHWEFNSYELQPASHLVMRSLITGKSNINGTCDDFYHAPLWSYYTNEKMQSVIIEKLADSKESILQIAECKDSHPKWNPQYYFKLDGLNLDKSTMKPFSVLERGKIKNPGKYYDASCNDKECNNDLLTSFSYIMDEVLRYEKNFNLIVRDFSAEKYFKKNEFEKWNKWIIEWSQVISYLQNALTSIDTLILVTGVSPVPLQYPPAGAELKKWLTQNKGIQLRQRSYLGKTWAFGARSENFCGLYKSNDYLQRIFWQNNDKSILGF